MVANRAAAAALAPGGVLVVVEWAWERFDAATAKWCFARLPEPDDGWLCRRRAEWTASGQAWDIYLRSWADGDGLHTGQDVLRALSTHFDCQSREYGPYFFPDLARTSEADEQAAIDAADIQATRIQYAGRRVPGPA